MPSRQLFIAACVLTASTTIALAHSGATGIVKQRMEAMKAISASMKEIGAMMKGEAEFDAELISARAVEMKQHASEMPAMFPEGSGHGVSEALPVIWESFERFSSIASDLESASDELAAVSSIEQLPGAMVAVGKTCKACHRDYRKP